MLIKRTAFALCALAACTDSDDTALLDDTSQESVFDVGYLWPKDDLTVCWEPSAFDDSRTPDVVDDVFGAERGWVREIVESSWGRHARINFNTWGPCASTPNPDIRIGNGHISHPFSHIGKTSLGRSPSMLLNLKCTVPEACVDPDLIDDPPDNEWLAMCNGFLVNGVPPQNARVCIETVALHEFGHAIGLRHEQAHPDESCPTASEVLDAADNFGTFHDGEALGPYDASSIMNYCVSTPTMHGTIKPKISHGDIININTLYPAPPSLFTGQNLDGFPQVFGPGVHNVSAGFAKNTRSFHATAGYTVTLCGPGGCYTGNGATSWLPSYIDNNVTTVTVKTQAAGYVDTGHRGQSAMYLPGKYMAINNTLKLPNDQLSSLFTPHGVTMTICRHEGAAPSYPGLECAAVSGTPASDDNPAVKLVPYYDQNTSLIKVSTFVQLYDSPLFRNSSRGSYPPGTYRTSSGLNFTNLRSWIIPQDLELTVCTGEGTGEGTGCQIIPRSGDVPASLINTIKMIKVRLIPVAVPPCQTC